MPDRDEVIERLQKVSHYFKSMLKVGYDGDADVYAEHKESVKMAIALLKEQQEHDGSFIVIDAKTGKEADTYNIALYEDWAKHLCYCDMDGWAIQDDGSLLLLDECGRYAYADKERFKVVWDG